MHRCIDHYEGSDLRHIKLGALHQWRNETQLLFFFTFYGKIALQLISYAMKLFMAKTLAAKMLMARQQRTLLALGNH